AGLLLDPPVGPLPRLLDDVGRRLHGEPALAALHLLDGDFHSDLETGTSATPEHGGSARQAPALGAPGAAAAPRRERDSFTDSLSGARGGSRTPKGFRPLDPKSSASADFATLARARSSSIPMMRETRKNRGVCRNSPAGRGRQTVRAPRPGGTPLEALHRPVRHRRSDQPEEDIMRGMKRATALAATAGILAVWA